MFFVANCIDGPNGPEIRGSDVRPQHLSFIEGLGDQIKMAGPLLNNDGAPIGSLLIIEAENEDVLQAILNEDPYAKAGLFQSVTVSPVKPLLGSWLV